MKRIILFLTIVLTSLHAAAQDNTVTITLRNGQTVTYNIAQYDSLRVLRNLQLTQSDNVGVKVYLIGGKSVDYIATKVEINSGISDDNINRNRYSRNNHSTWMLEMPRLSTDSINNLFLQKSTTQYGVTYSIEWDCAKKAQRWTAYQFHAGIPDNNVGRTTGSFHDDPEIPTAYRTHDNDYTGSGFCDRKNIPFFIKNQLFHTGHTTFSIAKWKTSIMIHKISLSFEIKDRHMICI